MANRLILLLGAGATRSDESLCKTRFKPPLDRGFFADITGHKSYRSGIRKIELYLENTYGKSPFTDDEFDSLESVVRVIYTDIYSNSASHEAEEAFRAILQLYNRRIAETTNAIPPKNSNVTRLLRDWALPRYEPDQIAFITFNHDIQIEKTLHHLQSKSPASRLFDFPNCYRFVGRSNVTRPNSGDVFPTSLKFKFRRPRGISVLKLHGSLNWYSRHNSKSPTVSALMNKDRRLYITARRKILTDMTITGNRRLYSFPVVVPPVIHKAGVLPTRLKPIWNKAENLLSEAEEIVVFGYSCPEADIESDNLMRRALRANDTLSSLSIIDPAPSVYARYGTISEQECLTCYKSIDAFLR